MGETHKIRRSVIRIASHHPSPSAVFQRLQTGMVQRHDPNPEALLTRLRLTRVVHRPRMWHAVSVTLRLPSLKHRRQHIGRPRRHCTRYMLLLRQPRLLLHLRRQRPKSMI